MTNTNDPTIKILETGALTTLRGLVEAYTLEDLESLNRQLKQINNQIVERRKTLAKTTRCGVHSQVTTEGLDV